MRVLQTRYKVLGVLGKGGMGTVYLAHDLELDRKVAIKLILQELRATPMGIQRFCREAKILAEMQHPGIVQILDIFLDADQPFFVMEYVEGQDLRSHLASSGPLSFRETLSLAKQLGSVLISLQERKIHHRDVKPANIMVRKQDGCFLLTDLGLARRTDRTFLTLSGEILGTPLYHPPEYLLHGSWEDTSDQYQLGALLFEALSGTGLVSGNSINEVMERILEGRWNPFPAQLSLSPKVKKVLRRSTSRMARDRYPSIREFLQELTKASEDSQEGRPPVPSSRIPSLGKIVLLGIFLLVPIALPWWSRRNAHEPPKDLQWKVVGTTLLSTYQGAPRKTHMEVNGHIIEAAPIYHPRTARTRLRCPLPIPPEGLQARLVWKGGGSPLITVKASSLAIGGTFHLSEKRHLGLRIRRPCVVRWKRQGSEPILFLPGDHFIPDVAPLTHESILTWREAGENFHMQIPRKDLLQKCFQRVLEEAPSSAYDTWLVTIKKGITFGVKMRSYQWYPWKGIAPWIPDLLTGPLEKDKKLRTWSIWDQMAGRLEVERGFSHPGESLLLPIDEAGSWNASPRPPETTHVVRVKQFFHDPDLQRPISVSVQLKTPYAVLASMPLINSGASDLVSAAYFTWPRNLPRRGTLQVSLRVRIHENLPMRIKVYLGPPLQLTFWCPNPMQVRRSRFHGWITRLLPAELAPSGGTLMKVFVKPFFQEETSRDTLEEMRISWSP
jgi:serine/threonine protein kinase